MVSNPFNYITILARRLSTVFIVTDRCPVMLIDLSDDFHITCSCGTVLCNVCSTHVQWFTKALMIDRYISKAFLWTEEYDDPSLSMKMCIMRHGLRNSWPLESIVDAPRPWEDLSWRSGSVPIPNCFPSTLSCESPDQHARPCSSRIAGFPYFGPPRARCLRRRLLLV